MDLFTIFEIASGIAALITVASIFIKPIRERIFNSRKANDGERCLLRGEILRIYYKNLDNRTIRQYEMEQYIKLYEAYKALGGNSFVDEIDQEIRSWKVIR